MTARTSRTVPAMRRHDSSRRTEVDIFTPSGATGGSSLPWWGWPEPVAWPAASQDGDGQPDHRDPEAEGAHDGSEPAHDGSEPAKHADLMPAREIEASKRDPAEDPGEDDGAPKHGAATQEGTGRRSMAGHGETFSQAREMLLKEAIAEIAEDAEPDALRGHIRVLEQVVEHQPHSGAVSLSKGPRIERDDEAVDALGPTPGWSVHVLARRGRRRRASASACFIRLSSLSNSARPRGFNR